jgi:hypothetical protein
LEEEVRRAWYRHGRVGVHEHGPGDRGQHRRQMVAIR